MLSKIKKFGLAAAVTLSLFAKQAEAFTLRVSESGNPAGSTLQVEDGGLGDLDGVLNGSIQTGHVVVGAAGASIRAEISEVSFHGGGTKQSRLHLFVSDAFATVDDLLIDVGHSAFGHGAFAPGGSDIALSGSTHSISLGGQVSPRHFVQNVSPGKGASSPESDLDFQSLEMVLTAPFLIGIATTIHGGTHASFETTVAVTTPEVAVLSTPTPAAGLMMLTAFTCIAALRRRREAT